MPKSAKNKVSKSFIRARNFRLSREAAARHEGRYVRVLRRLTDVYPEIGTVCWVGQISTSFKTGLSSFYVFPPHGIHYFEVSPEQLDDAAVFESVPPPSDIQVGDRFLFTNPDEVHRVRRSIVVTEVDPIVRAGITRLVRYEFEIKEKHLHPQGFATLLGLRFSGNFAPLNRAARVRARIKPQTLSV